MTTSRSRRRYDLAAVGLAAVLGALLTLGEVVDGGRPSPAELALWLGLGALACAALGLRRRWPVALALGLTPASIVSPAALGAAAVAVYTVAAERPWRVAVPVAAAHATALSAAWSAVLPPNARVGAVIAILALHVATVTSGMLVRSRQALVASLRDRAAAAEAEQQLRVDEARHRERERLAREMHDVLAHRISLLAVHAGALEVRPGAAADEREAVGVIRTSAYAALEDLRDVLGMLDGPGVDGPGVDGRGLDGRGLDGAGVDGDRPQPTLADLDTLLAEARRAGTVVRLDRRVTDVDAVPTALGRHAYRVVQEALTNARKHAAGGAVAVTLEGVAGVGLDVEVANAAPPARTTSLLPGSGRGLLGLRERVDLLGGTLEHGPTPDGGYRLRAWLPWPR